MMSLLPELFGESIKSSGSTVADTVPGTFWDGDRLMMSDNGTYREARWDEIVAFGQQADAKRVQRNPISADGDDGRVSWLRLAGTLALSGLPASEAADICDRFEWEAGFSVQPLADILPAITDMAGSAEFSSPDSSPPPLPAESTPADEWVTRACDIVSFQAADGMRDLSDPDAAGRLVRAVKVAPSILYDQHRLAVFAALADGVDVPSSVRVGYPETLSCPEPAWSIRDRLVVADDGRWFAALPDGVVKSGRVASIEAEQNFDAIIVDLVRRMGSATSHPFSVPAGRPTAVALDGQTRYVILPAPLEAGLFWQAHAWVIGGQPVPLPLPPTADYDSAVRSLAVILPPTATITDPVAIKAIPDTPARAAERIMRMRDDEQAATVTAPTAQVYWQAMRQTGATLPKVKAKITVKTRDGDREVACVMCGPLAIHRSLTPGAKWSVSHGSSGLLMADCADTKSSALALASALDGVVGQPRPTIQQIQRAASVIRAFRDGTIPPPPHAPVQGSLFSDEEFLGLI